MHYHISLSFDLYFTIEQFLGYYNHEMQNSLCHQHYQLLSMSSMLDLECCHQITSNGCSFFSIHQQKDIRTSVLYCCRTARSVRRLFNSVRSTADGRDGKVFARFCSNQPSENPLHQTLVCLVLRLLLLF